MNWQVVGGTAVAVIISVSVASTQAPAPASADALVSSAKSAAGLDWSGTFLRLCVVPPPPEPRPAAAAPAPPPGPPTKAAWFAEPAKVADNLYFLGTKLHHAWALVGSDGIIVIEGLFDYAAPDEVVGGMRKMGLDTQKVKYIVMSHAHGDHDGGAKYLQEVMLSARLLYGGPDWDLVEKTPNRAGGIPKRDMVATDGMRLSVGDASIQIVTMPGHTAGTLSYLFEVKDQGKPLRIAYVGGTAIQFNADAAYYDTYVASTRKMAKAAADYGATAILSNHTEFDNGYFKAHTAAGRKAGEANPFDVGKAGVARYFTVVDNCTSAAKLRSTSGK